MRKNGSRLISIRQYRFTDLFFFAVILAVIEVVLHFAFIAYNGDFFFSPVVLVVALVMVRWGWESVFFAVGDGLLFCLLNMDAEWFSPALFAVYIIGNAFIMLLLLATKFFGKKKMAGKWYFTALFALLGWVAVTLGRALVALCFGGNFGGFLLGQITDLSWILSLAVAVIMLIILRRVDGMFEDQKQYLLRKDREKKELAKRDAYGDEPIDIDEQSISILNKKNDDEY